ncbi:cytochrome P450 [Rhodococcus sp. NPDC059968]|uniref:cytochrome P450 n=1 Tax=Rhodococcus sp. NPDC059968 TaxID=3347017 RepID=UPI00366F6809
MTNHELARILLNDPRLSVFPAGPPASHPERQAAQLYDAIRRDDSFPQSVRELIGRYGEEGRLADAFRNPEVIRTLHEQPPGTLSFFYTDPPEHLRLRRILAPYFSVRRVGERRARIEQIVSDRLDLMEKIGPPVDFVKVFAQAIPSLVTCAMFGLPDSEIETFERLALVRHAADATADDNLAAIRSFHEFGRQLISRKRAQPGSDMLSALIADDQLTDEQLATTAVLLVQAAHATTAHSLAFSVVSLLRDRDRWDELKTGSAPINQIVEELLRFTTIDQSPDVRTALEDIEVGGTVIKAYDNVVVLLSAVNRDPAVFEEPDRLDFTRRASSHMSFGYGVHQCLGQHLARLEMEVALTGLADRFPNLDFAVPLDEIPWYPADRQLIGPVRVPVTW